MPKGKTKTIQFRLTDKEYDDYDFVIDKWNAEHSNEKAKDKTSMFNFMVDYFKEQYYIDKTQQKEYNQRAIDSDLRAITKDYEIFFKDLGEKGASIEMAIAYFIHITGNSPICKARNVYAELLQGRSPRNDIEKSVIADIDKNKEPDEIINKLYEQYKKQTQNDIKDSMDMVSIFNSVADDMGAGKVGFNDELSEPTKEQQLEVDEAEQKNKDIGFYEENKMMSKTE